MQDKYTNRISVFDVIDELRIAAAPPESESVDSTVLIAQPFHLLAVIARSDFGVAELGDAQISIANPDGSITVLSEVDVNLNDFMVYRIWTANPGLSVTLPGTYTFLVDCKPKDGEWGTPYEVPLLVRFA